MVYIFKKHIFRLKNDIVRFTLLRQVYNYNLRTQEADALGHETRGLWYTEHHDGS